MRLLLLSVLMLVGCGGGSSNSSATQAINFTWPPKTPAELLQATKGHTYTIQLVNYSDTLSISDTQLIYYGPASDWHTATVFTDLTHSYQTYKACNYVGTNLQISSDFTLSYTLSSNTNYEPGGIQNCKLNVGSSSISFTAESNCLVYDGNRFCY